MLNKINLHVGKTCNFYRMLTALALVATSATAQEFKRKPKICESILTADGHSPMISRLENMIIGRVPTTPILGVFRHYATLKAAVRSSQNIDSFLEKLPASMRQDYALVMSSNSSMFGSPKFPRAILSSPDSSLMLTFSGAKGERGFDVIEAAIFDLATKTFTPYEIRFDGGRGKIATNPKRCAQCHGINFRPIWDSYPFWPAFFGSDSGVIYRGMETSQRDSRKKTLIGSEHDLFQREAKLYFDFQKGRSRTRYRHLTKNPDLLSLVKSNEGIGLNLVIFRRLQMDHLINELRKSHPQIIAILDFVIGDLATPMNSSTDIRPYLAKREQSIYDRDIQGIRESMKKKIESLRTRKIAAHYQSLGLPTPSAKNLFNVTRVPFLDFDVVSNDPRTSPDEDIMSIEASKKYVNLYFLWVRLLGRTFADLNMSLDPNELPTMATPVKNGWRF